jgi:hypothetical protein
VSKLDKLKTRLKNVPKDFTYSEARRLLTSLGFVEHTKGKTSGSRVKYYRANDNKIFMLHKPHPSDTIGICDIKDLIEFLTELGEI